jgi:RNA polymerase sigma-70 factor (ECF subfamily)
MSDFSIGSGDAKNGYKDSALVPVFVANKARLARFLRLRCGEDEIDDILQELWLKARAVNGPVEKPLAYLYRMADRLVLDSRRGASRLKSRDNDWSYVHNRSSEAVEQPTAERSLLARERLNAAELVIRQVGERAASIFRRYRLDGMDQRMIAHEFGVSISTVEKDLRKTFDALLTLRDRLDEE